MPLPAVAEIAQRVGAGAELTLHGDELVEMNGRFFLRVRAHVPLDWPQSPVAALLWVEVEEDVVTNMLNYRAGRSDWFAATGTLACDWPGFPGAIGARVTIETDESAGTPRISWVSDERLRLLSRQNLSHEAFVVLYRRAWGGAGVVAKADHSLRRATIEALRELGERPVFLHEITPPGKIAGIEPAAVGVLAPRDTGDEAILATIGNAEAQVGPELFELLAFARNPTQGFRSSFAEFCYWTRLSNLELTPGTIVRERRIVPGCQEMSAWLIYAPWEIRGLSEPVVELGARSLRFHAAAPITNEEEAYAEARGGVELAAHLTSLAVDLSDLSRSSFGR